MKKIISLSLVLILVFTTLSLSLQSYAGTTSVTTYSLNFDFYNVRWTHDSINQATYSITTPSVSTSTKNSMKVTTETGKKINVDYVAKLTYKKTVNNKVIYYTLCLTNNGKAYLFDSDPNTVTSRITGVTGSRNLATPTPSPKPSPTPTVMPFIHSK